MSSQTNKKASPLMVIIAFAIVYVVWGSTYFFLRVALQGFPPMVIGAVRFSIAGLAMLGWCLFKGEKVFVLKDIFHAAISGIMLLFIAMVAILVSAAPIWFVLLDFPKWGENLRSKWTVAGLLIGFLGVILLFWEQIATLFKAGAINASIWTMAVVVLGSMSWSGGSIYSKYKAVGVSGPVNSTWQMLAAGVVYLIASFGTGEVQHLNWHTIPTNAWLAMAYLITFGSLIAFSAYVWLLQVRPATQVSTYAYVNPLIAVILGVFFARESISFLQILGLVVILCSVMLINLAKHYKAGRVKAAA
jgi:drug/metabolite transporter (DMT)-like permease